VLRQQAQFEVVGLFTTFNQAADRVAMHAVRRELAEEQSRATGLPLWRVPLPWPCSNEEYERRLRELLAQARSAGITAMAFGDLFLEDIRAYRTRQLAGSGIEPLFPIWNSPSGTSRLAQEMLAAGLRAVLTCVDPQQLDRRFAGRKYDAELLADLPPNVDPCGERGEFHTFCYAGPMFAHPIPCVVGERVERDGFCFADVLPLK
jgi:diphthamide synthase (EF-2-diphthine--ammonia ligase)